MDKRDKRDKRDRQDKQKSFERCVTKYMILTSIISFPHREVFLFQKIYVLGMSGVENSQLYSAALQW
ncbi:hypothetical protein J2Z66_007375 [Paenibacillus eucommiae]|uniref:Uncharacterized protein n=1 Tax=Paenibacillus eucommiae TaxID=1355755 RepID=A0ABS4J7D9_9BACL|nr:hypothetical protein [Paenibacillus eucommiae]